MCVLDRVPQGYSEEKTCRFTCGGGRGYFQDYACKRMMEAELGRGRRWTGKQLRKGLSQSQRMPLAWDDLSELFQTKEGIPKFISLHWPVIEAQSGEELTFRKAASFRRRQFLERKYEPSATYSQKLGQWLARSWGWIWATASICCTEVPFKHTWIHSMNFYGVLTMC